MQTLRKRRTYADACAVGGTTRCDVNDVSAKLVVLAQLTTDHNQAEAVC